MQQENQQPLNALTRTLLLITPEAYEARCIVYETEGMDRSDAQAVLGAELMQFLERLDRGIRAAVVEGMGELEYDLAHNDRGPLVAKACNNLFAFVAAYIRNSGGPSLDAMQYALDALREAV